MRYLLAAALFAFPVAASASPGTAPVIGGAAAPAGRWPDAAAILWSGEQACSGTLIAPTVVITAGHCTEGGAPDQVLVGATAKSRPQEGETLDIQRAVAYPDSQSTIDVALLILAQPSTIAPRLIATGWARAEIYNNASIQLVGYGTTDKNGTVDTDALLEANTTITDYNCATSSGCNTGARPDGELGAGGMGIDTCPGDSGGPLYVLTSYGDFLAGVTSRGYDSNQFYCSEGGIYARPDKVIDWIETTAGVTLERTPGPTADPIVAVRGTGTETKVAPNDPLEGTKHTFAIGVQPAYGKAAVSSDGVVRVCPRKDVVGDDSVVVNVSDASTPGRTAQLKIPITITDGSPDDDCDPTDFGGGGCCDTRRSASGSIPLALFVAFGLRRRRRTR